MKYEFTFYHATAVYRLRSSSAICNSQQNLSNTKSGINDPYSLTLVSAAEKVKVDPNYHENKQTEVGNTDSSVFCGRHSAFLGSCNTDVGIGIIAISVRYRYYRPTSSLHNQPKRLRTQCVLSESTVSARA